MTPEERKAALLQLNVLRKQLSIALKEENKDTVKEKYEARKAVFATLKEARNAK